MPCLSPLKRTRCFPRGVRGPVLRWAFLRLLSALESLGVHELSAIEGGRSRAVDVISQVQVVAMLIAHPETFFDVHNSTWSRQLRAVTKSCRRGRLCTRDNMKRGGAVCGLIFWEICRAHRQSRYLLENPHALGRAGGRDWPTLQRLRVRKEKKLPDVFSVDRQHVRRLQIAMQNPPLLSKRRAVGLNRHDSIESLIKRTKPSPVRTLTTPLGSRRS
jgi:hypothetical protein